MTSAVTKKSGKGLSDGVVSELAAYFTVRPGHEEQLRTDVQPYNDALSADKAATMKTGLRSSRHVIFDNGRRLMWATTFETDWDPYFDDALLTVGLKLFINWMRHTEEGQAAVAVYEEHGGEAAFEKSAAGFEERAVSASQKLKEIVQSCQSPAVAYFEFHGDQTTPQIRRGKRLQAAFDEVLESPEAEQALQHPALKPLLELAAD
jgi:hypothetical protein